MPAPWKIGHAKGKLLKNTIIEIVIEQEYVVIAIIIWKRQFIGNRASELPKTIHLILHSAV